jgi:hypothetical protein
LRDDALCDENGDLRYIGKANDPASRLKGHLRETGRRRTPLYDWLRKHGEPTMIVLESDCTDWRQAERAWIADARLSGASLLNLADGGDEPFCSTECRRANALTLNERRRTDPRFRRLWKLKRDLGNGLRLGFVGNSTRAKLRLLAAKRPDMFGAWTNLPDREEAA